MTISQAIIYAQERLSVIAERPRLEAEILLSHFLGVERVYLMTHGDDVVDDSKRFVSLVERRAQSEPIEYITGRVSFYDIELEVGEGVLIPRPETEILVDKVAKIIRKNNFKLVAEIGIGSGAISIVLARMFPHLHIIATDISPEAISIARDNVKLFGLNDRIEIRECSLLDCVDEEIEMIISNPPYIANSEKLDANVYDYEPHTALFGGESGDELLLDIITLAKERGAGYLACEMGYDQRQAIVKFVGSIKGAQIEFYTDLAGLDRGFVCRF